MKRGRPAMRNEFRRDILGVLADGQYPVTITSVKRVLDTRKVQSCSWHTVRKYLEELVAERLVLRQALPTRLGRKPLVLYLGRNRPNQ